MHTQGSSVSSVAFLLLSNTLAAALAQDRPDVATSVPTAASAATTAAGPFYPNTTYGSVEYGTGYSYALSCQAAYDRYATSSAQFGNTAVTPTTLTDTLIATLGGSVTYTGTFTTLCDGIPRLVGNITTVTVATPTYSYTSAYTITRSDPNYNYTKAPPSCSINPTDCLSLWSSYSRATSLFPYGKNHTSWAREPSCTTPGQTVSCRAQNCMIAPQGEGVRLLYWPVTTVGGNMCGRNGSTVTFGPTVSGQPNTFVTMGTTITSPDVGLLFGAISRTDGCGPTLSNYLLTLHATEVSSLWGIRIDKTPKSFDFNDLNQECGPDGCYPLVPWKAYANAPGCYTIPGESPKCEKTIMWSYAPQLQYPARMTTLEPAWGSSCGLHIVGVWDPPRVMTTEGSFDVPVATEATTTAPATAEAVQTQAPEASPTISSPAAYETAAPETDAPQTGAEETYYSPHVENTVDQTQFATPQTAAGETYYSAHLENTVDGTALAAPQPQTQNSAQPTGVAGAILSGLNGQNPSPAQSNAAPGGSAGTTAAQPAVSRAVVIVGSDTYTVSADASSTWVGSSTYKAGDTISSWPAGFSNGNGNGNGNNNGGGSGNGNNGNGAGSRSVASIVTNGIAVGGSTYVFTPAPTAGSPGGVVASGAVINVGGQTQIVSPAGSAGAVAIGSHTLVPGSAAATIEGTVYSAAPNGVVIDGQTVAYSALAPAVTPTTSGAVITVNGVAQTVSYVSGAPGAVVVGSQTLLPGSAAAMIGGTVYSAASSGIVVGSQTVAYSVLEPAVTDAPSGAVVTINGQAQTVSRLADLSGAVVIGSQTLVPGSSAVTIGGTIYSAAPGGLVVGTQTVAYSALQGGAVPTQTGVQITVGGHTTSAIRSANGVVVIGSQTLTPGSSAVTIDGTVYSAAQSGLVVGTQYIPYSALAAATSTATSVSGASGSITRTRASSSPSRFSSEANAATASATTSTKGSAAGLTALCREGLVVWLGCIVLTLGAAVAL